MPSYCCVHEPHEASKSIFGAPKNAEIKILWEEALGMQLKKSHRVCAKHFYKSDIISTWDSGQGSSKYIVCLKRLQLKKGAIPINVKHDNINICNENVVLPLGLTPSLNINKQIDFGNVSNCEQTFIEPFIPSNALIPPESKKRKLVSLKAELLRKQDEANKAKSFSGDTFIRPIPGAKTPSCLLQSNEGVEKRNAKDLEEEYTPDVENSLKKSRDVLTMKAKLYDKLVKGEMVSEQDKTFLVDFKQKVTENKTTYPVSSTKDNVKEQEKSDSDADLDKYDSGADDDWIDYTDFFGRTRRCLKTDLEFFKNRDQRIEKELEPPPPSPNTIKQQTSITAQQFVKEGRNPEEISELVSSDMRREQLRLKWEEEERKLAERTDIHYEDIRFDEVREHGVGYYSFSTDEKERHRQQAELKKLREQTKTTQISVQKLKEKRAAQMAIRLKAIKRRKKEKLGLPIDSSSDEEAPPPKAPSPEVAEEDMDAERAFEKLRKAAHVRPWDHGKDGLQKPLLTQEEWNEKQRAERKPDFAWDYNEGPKVPKSVSSNNYRPDDDEDDDNDDDDDDEDMVGPSLDMFVAPSNPNKQSTITSKSFKKFIHNELDDEPATTQNKPYQDDDLDSIPLPTEQRTGAEIAPPPTYEYYGPSGRGPKAQDNFISTNEMQDSISKGFTSAKSMNKHRPVRGIVDDDDDE